MSLHRNSLEGTANTIKIWVFKISFVNFREYYFKIIRKWKQGRCQEDNNLTEEQETSQGQHCEIILHTETGFICPLINNKYFTEINSTL